MIEQNGAMTAVSPGPRPLYQELLGAISSIGPFREEAKKTSVRLVRGSAFAGAHPRKQYLLVTIKAEKAIRSATVAEAEPVSKNRWHLDVKIVENSDINAEFLGWLRHAYDLCI